MCVKIVLAEDHTILRQGLAALLRFHDNRVQVFEASDGRTAVSLVASERPDIVVMDIAMPELNGIDATRRIVSEHPGIKVVALSAYSDRKRVVEMLRAGARAYVMKQAAFEELEEAISTVMQGKMFLSRRLTESLQDQLPAAPDGGLDLAGLATVDNRLTPREREVLQLIAEGKATKEVAAILKVSVKTAETHRRSIMEKLHVDGVAEMTKYALSEGLTSLEH